jgi:hypothetical protein
MWVGISVAGGWAVLAPRLGNSVPNGMGLDGSTGMTPEITTVISGVGLVDLVSGVLVDSADVISIGTGEGV